MYLVNDSVMNCIGFFYLDIVGYNGLYYFIDVFCRLVCFLLFLIVRVFIVYV